MSHCPTCAIIVSVVRLKTTSGGSRRDTERSRATGGERLAEAITAAGSQTESWSYQTMWTTDARIAGRSHLRIMSGLRVYCGGQLYISKKWRSAERNEVQGSGTAKIHGRFPGSCFSGRRGQAYPANTWRKCFAHLH